MSNDLKSTIDRPLNPGETLGIIGGGQLGRMLAMAAARFSIRTIVLDPDHDCPASQVCNETIVGAYDDAARLSELANRADRITYEFENIPVSSIRKIENICTIYPDANVLEASQDRLVEKQMLNDIGIQTAEFSDITSLETLIHSHGQFGERSILKTRRLGYDGKGQFNLAGKNNDELTAIWNEVEGTELILEKMVPFDCEVSIIIARDTSGNIAAFDLAENVHRDGILHTSTVPAKISDALKEKAIAAATKIVDHLSYVGVMGVEFFVCGKDIIANEIAPRVHNSGHWTEAACLVSQFEQHVRAVCGYKLGNPVRSHDCVMENLIGNDITRAGELVQEDRLLLHLYGKREIKPGRKMGHFTRVMES